ncbi:DoxX family protein [Labrys neptuniae]
MSSDTRYIPLLGRVLIAAIFLISGLGKIANPGMIAGYISAMGLPLPYVGVAIAIIVEVAGSLLLIAGYQTRLVALVLAAFSIATAVLFHGALGDQNQFIHFFKNIAMAGGLLQVVAFGAGSLSVDAIRQSRKTIATA